MVDEVVETSQRWMAERRVARQAPLRRRMRYGPEKPIVTPVVATLPIRVRHLVLFQCACQHIRADEKGSPDNADIPSADSPARGGG